MKYVRGSRLSMVGAFVVLMALAGSSGAQVTTLGATGISSNNGAATLNASVNPEGHETSVLFVWGETAGYGNTNAVLNIGAGESPVLVSAVVTGLSSLTNYYFRAVATNAVSTNSGGQLEFSTPFYPGGLSHPALTNGALEVTLSGTTNAAYGIYGSTNLVNWTLLPPGQFIYLAARPFQIDIAITNSAGGHWFYLMR